MLKNNILIKITGSIAAYKVGYLISKLVQNGYQVKTVVTEAALKFIGEATLEGLTGNPVFKDSFESGKMMSHINLVKWANITILVPADANTINKISAGIADNLVTTLFLARDESKPYLIAPAMNVAMFNHPITKNSLSNLTSWGVKVLPTEEGILACGDEGKGKLIDPDKIYTLINHELNSSNKKRNILITSGGTNEKIDSVRYLSNMSTGRTGAILADYFSQNGYKVRFVKSKHSASPKLVNDVIEYEDFKSLKEILHAELGNHSFDLIIHLAAVSDYSPRQIISNGQSSELPLESKIISEAKEIKITLKRNPKIITQIKTWSKNKNVKLIGFKLVDANSAIKKELILNKIFDETDADSIVFNSLENRHNDIQKNFELITTANKSHFSSSAQELAKNILEIFFKES